ncbi:MAG: CHAT domain-containing tetratricopeptide repeat protein, partial [Ferruginibacter sp.]
LGKEHPDYANSLNNLAGLYSDMKQYEKAEPLYLEAKNIREKALGKEHPDYANSLNNLAGLYSDMGQYEKAESLYIEAKNIREKVLGKADPDYASSLNKLAILYNDMGQYEKAESLYIEAKNIREKALGKADPDYAGSLNNLAAFYYDMGQYEKAMPLLIEAKNIREKVLGKAHPDYASSLDNLAILYNDMGQYEKAEPLYKEAKNIREKALGKAHPDYASSLEHLAGLYNNMGQYQKAESLYKMAKNIKEKVLSKTHPDYASSLDGLANLYSDMGHYEKAEPLYIEAKYIREKALGKEHPDYANSLNNLAGLYWVTNKPLEADSLYKEAFTINYSQVRKTLQFTSEREKVAFISNIIGSNDFYNSFYYQSYSHDAAAEPFTISFLSHNLILSSSQQLRKLINRSNDKKAVADYEKWSSLKKQLAAFYSKGKNGANIKNLEDSADVLEQSLARASTGFKKVQEDKTWQEIQKSLKENESAIEFVTFHYYTGKRWTDSTFYIALVLRKDKKEPILVPLFEKKQIDSLLLQTGNKKSNDNVTALYALRGVGVRNTAVLSKSLYNLIWKPLEKELKGINSIYFAPAGVLNRVAFAALPVNDKQVLSDQYKLIQLASTSLIIDQQPFYVSDSDKIILYGGISYNADTMALKTVALTYHIEKGSSRSLPADITRGETWNDLPGTVKEVEGIVSVGKNENNISVLSGINATEESIKALEGNNSPVVLHIATHGFFFPDPKLEKKSNIEKGFENGKVFKQAADPLFRSGLLFAGANNTWSGKVVNGIEDGILTSYEVSNMYLPNTKLVILSACETGLGDIQGNEGVYGLQRAFKMAGAENLIMSLWKVPDDETAEFMQGLYKNFFAKQSIADAFYNMQTTMKNKYRNDPYKWAAWVLVR